MRPLGQALGPLVRRRIERVGLVFGQRFVSGDGIEISRFAGDLRCQADDFVNGLYGIGGGCEIKHLRHSLSGSPENLGQQFHVEIGDLYDVGKSQVQRSGEVTST